MLLNNCTFKICRDIDPDGRRTLAVITKLDLMDAGMIILHPGTSKGGGGGEAYLGGHYKAGSHGCRYCYNPPLPLGWKNGSFLVNFYCY